TNLTATACDSASVNGTWYYTTQTVTDNFTTSLGCDSTVITDLTINNSVITNLTETACDSASVNGTWYYTTQTVTDNFTTSLGCDSTVITDLTINNSVITTSTASSCDRVSLKGNWYYSSQTVTEVFKTALGCDSIHHTYVTILKSTSSEINVSLCNGTNYTLPDGRIVSESGRYVSTITNSQGCDSVITTVISIHDINYNPVEDITKCLGDDAYIDLWNNGNMRSYKWSNGGTESSINTKEFGTFTVDMLDGNGCLVSDTIEIIDKECEPCKLFVPNAFTPNSNGLNETFVPVSLCEFTDYRFEIYNRWGERVMETNDPTHRWDGTYEGRDCQQDAYMWILFYVDKSTMMSISDKGTVTLLR
ncbi:MAG: gliding motility-associated C-terminal domain-containing protein, partial [Bacteroidia bacterium]|nr:gliding motility-associated C-terminal domain-containing protein [Bacteroidia bacterium]